MDALLEPNDTEAMLPSELPFREPSNVIPDLQWLGFEALGVVQVACRAFQKQALQEAGQTSKVQQLELGVQQAALDHQRLEQELTDLLVELSLEPTPAARPQLSHGEPASDALVAELC